MTMTPEKLLAQLRQAYKNGDLDKETTLKALGVDVVDIKDSQVGVVGDNAKIEGGIQHGDRTDIDSGKDTVCVKGNGKAYNIKDSPIIVVGNVHFHASAEASIPPYLNLDAKEKEKNSNREDIQKLEPVPHVDPSDFIHPGGAVSVDSLLYIQRDADDKVINGVNKNRGMVTIRGPRQTGKTSLILRLYKKYLCQSSEVLRPVLLDFEAFPGRDFNSLDMIWQALSMRIDTQLGINRLESEGWNPNRCYEWNLGDFMDRFVFSYSEVPLLLCLDGVDRIFDSPIKSEFFASVRHFYNWGAHDSTWEKVRWILSTSSEPAFFIDNLNQSPFNVGIRVKLSAFSSEEITKLAQSQGISFGGTDIIYRIMKYIGGHPYLVQLMLYHMALKPDTVERLFDPFSGGDGVFIEHLDRYLNQFQKEPQLAQAMKRIIAGRGCKDIKILERLVSAGLVRRDQYQNVVCACTLYADFFAGKL